MKSLTCVVVGDGSVFVVEIDKRKKVGILKDKIKEKKMYNFPADQLTLYVAKKGGNWLTMDDPDVLQLKEGVVAPAISDIMKDEMKAGYRVRNKAFGFPDEDEDEDEDAADGEIHVLVELPQAAVDVASETSSTAQMVKEMYDRVVLAKRKRYVHSDVGKISSQGRELLQDLNIMVKPVRAIPFAMGNATPVQPFQWESVRDESGRVIIKLTEEQQRENYRLYVEDNIGDVLAAQELCVFGVEKGRNILSVKKVPGHENIELAGRTDLLILSSIVETDRDYLEYLPGVRMLIEVKRKVESGFVFQALSELIALDLLTDDPVMALLTDLTNDWQFFWVSERSSSHVIIQTVRIKKPGEAFQVIRTLLAQSTSSDTDINLPFCREPVKRRKLAQILPCISEGGESSGIREAIERYYDIASVLGPDIDMARAVADQVTRSIRVFNNPTFSYFS